MKFKLLASLLLAFNLTALIQYRLSAFYYLQHPKLELYSYQAEPFAELTPQLQRWVGSEEKYEKCIKRIPSYSNNFFRAFYKSDGLRVQGLVAVPKNFDAKKKYPLLLYLRGGNRDLGYMSVCNLLQIQEFGALLGDSIVIAPQYRGSPGSEGQDEFAGEDIHDVLRMAEIFSEFPFIEDKNQFAIGFSRGALQLYGSLKRGLKVNAAAAISGGADLIENERTRSDMAAMFAEMMPGYAQDRESVLKARSPIYWPELLRTPLLLVQGAEDWRVSPKEAIALAEKLKAIGAPHKLVVYSGNGHSLEKDYANMLLETKAWFANYRE
jgi:dipeptidyl aminopeptidase/acylaminoacyl peptidase